MKYEFHVGDYVETKSDARGYIDSVEEMLWKCTQSSNDYMYVAGHTYHMPVEGVDSCYNRIGQYDFTKKDNKIVPLPSDWQANDVINKINELIEAVNRLEDKINE